MLEVLDRSLVSLGGRSRLERAEVPSLAGLGIDLAGIQAVLAGLEFSNHLRLR